MALFRPLVLINGIITQLSLSDTLEANVSEVDVISLSNNQGSAVVIASPVCGSGSGQFRLGQANASGTIHLLGLSKDASVAVAANGLIQTDGVFSATTAQWDVITGQTGGLTPNSPYYLSAATVGKLTTVAPITVGQFVVRVGLAISTTQMDISVQPPIGL